MNKLQASVICALVAVVTCFGTGPVVAQDREQQHEDGMTLTVGAEVSHERNAEKIPDGDSARSFLKVPLSFGLGWSTPTTRLSLDASASYRAISGDPGLADPWMSLRFGHDSARSSLGISLQSIQTDASSAAYTAASDGEVDLTAASGQVNQTAGAVRFEGAKDRPLSYTVDLSHRITDFSQPDSATQFDNATTRAGGKMIAQIRPGSRFELEAKTKHYRADDPDNSSRDGFNILAAWVQEIDRITQARLTFGYGKERFVSDVETRERRDTPVVFEVTRETRGGHYRLRYSRDGSVDGAWQKLLVGRHLELRNGEIDWSLGTILSDTGETYVVGHLDYENALRNDVVSIGLSREFGFDLGGQETLTNGIEVAYDHSFSDVAGVVFELDATAFDGVAGNAAKLDGRVTYRRELQADVTMEAGVRVQLLDTLDAEAAWSETLFLSVNKTFSTR